MFPVCFSYSDGVKEGYEYNFAGLAAKTTDGNGNSVQYRYNSMGKVRERIDQLGEKETFLYDGEGNLILHSDKDGRRLRCTYNFLLIGVTIRYCIMFRMLLPIQILLQDMVSGILR